MDAQDSGCEGSQQRENQGFIPGLPNEIVLKDIVTKVPWSSMYTLATVSHEWREAIRSREIYNVRKVYGASQSMAVASVKLNTHKGFLDVERQDLYLFPPPGFLEMASAVPCSEDVFHRVPLQACNSDAKMYTASWVVFLDAKMYALQEIIRIPGPLNCLRQDVLVLDVGACERAWRHCSSSSVDNRTEMWVACNEKIYSFHTCQERLHGKVFDPASDGWTEIEDRPRNVCPSFAHLQPDGFGSYAKDYRDQVAVLKEDIYVGRTNGQEMMVFNSVTQKWRSIPNTLVTGRPRATEWLPSPSNFVDFSMVVIKGTIYNFSRWGVHVYNPESNSWTLQQRAISGAFRTHGGQFRDILAVACSGKGLFALLEVDHDVDFPDKMCRKLCRSFAFGVEGCTLLWVSFPEFSFKNCLAGRTGLVLSNLAV